MFINWQVQKLHQFYAFIHQINSKITKTCLFIHWPTDSTFTCQIVSPLARTCQPISWYNIDYKCLSNISVIENLMYTGKPDWPCRLNNDLLYQLNCCQIKCISHICKYNLSELENSLCPIQAFYTERKT